MQNIKLARGTWYLNGGGPTMPKRLMVSSWPTKQFRQKTDWFKQRDMEHECWNRSTLFSNPPIPPHQNFYLYAYDYAIDFFEASLWH